MDDFWKNIPSMLTRFLKYILPSSFSELLLFTITIVLVIVIVELFSYTNVQRKIKKNSRCYRDKVLNRPGVGIYTAVAKAKTGEELYKVTYDFGAKTYTITQIAKQGSVQSKITIPVYDLTTNTPTQVIKYFEMEKTYDTSSIIYTGYSGITKFMQYGNVDFFDKMIMG